LTRPPARDAERHETGDDDRGHDQQRQPLLIGGRELFEREGDAGERRVERCGHTGRAARNHHRRAQRHAEQAVHHQRHQARTHLDGR
jgi:hypothetical protein